MGAGAICLHASWRAASTYVWSKFRQQPGAYCYFEPLNEHLATATEAIIDRFRPWSFAHHPVLDAPYLEEFRPLIGAEGGVPGFPHHLSIGRYCADPMDDLPELESYLDRLAGLAAARGRRPVHGFVRTDLRVGWFRRHVGGAHIFIQREPRRQFLSMLGQAVKGNPYFLQRGLLILQRNMHAPVFAPLLSAIDMPGALDAPELRAVLEGRLAPETPLPKLYTIFYFMRLVARRRGAAQCDLVIDIDRLSLDEAYRGETENRLEDLTGMAISFADCRVERYETNLAWSGQMFDALERDIEHLAARVA